MALSIAGPLAGGDGVGRRNCRVPGLGTGGRSAVGLSFTLLLPFIPCLLSRRDFVCSNGFIY